MKLTARQYAQTLYESLQDSSPKDHDQILDNFVEALAMNNDLRMFEDVTAEYDKIDKAGKGIKIAEVTSAKPLEKSAEKKIIEHLNEMVKGKVEIKKKVDEKILGGVVIRMDDTLIDASVKKSLENLKNELAE